MWATAALWSKNTYIFPVAPSLAEGTRTSDFICLAGSLADHSLFLLTSVEVPWQWKHCKLSLELSVLWCCYCCQRFWEASQLLVLDMVTRSLLSSLPRWSHHAHLTLAIGCSFSHCCSLVHRHSYSFYITIQTPHRRLQKPPMTEFAAVGDFSKNHL